MNTVALTILLALPIDSGASIELRGALWAETVDSVNLCIKRDGQWYVTRRGRAYGTYPASEYAVRLRG